jgi:TM2 domain
MFLVLVPLWLGTGRACAAGPFTVTRQHWLVLAEGDSTAQAAVFVPNRALAAALALTLGPFGGHRLYFGTKPKVPLLYGLTFGGAGVLVLIDLGHILFTKDLTRYLDNDRVLMWAMPRTTPSTLP